MQQSIHQQEPLFLVVDLFCGFGGTTEGFAQALVAGNAIAKVIACINHDPKAITSHWLNHPDVKHFEEDIRTLDLTELVQLVEIYRFKYPFAKLILWASLECTNFSKAKGGLPRDADSRTLAEHLHRYIHALSPDYIQIENIVEFMSWGPLDAKGKPISRKNGLDWLRWRESIRQLGYADQWRELNSANYGAYTSRNRLFGVFAKNGLPIAWPEPTHAKNPAKGTLLGDLAKWKPVKEVLNFSDQGQSIFNRAKPLVDATLERIYAGLVKFVAKGDTSFISKYYSGLPAGMNQSVDNPSGTITTKDHHALIQAPFFVKYNSRSRDGSYNPPSIEQPAPVIATQDRLCLAQPLFIIQRNTDRPEAKIVDLDGPARTLTTTAGNQELVRPEFLTHYYSGGGQVSSIDEPCSTVTAMDGKAIVQPAYFLEKQFGNSQYQSVNVPAGTVMPNDKHRLVSTIPQDANVAYLYNPAWGGHPLTVENPCCVIVARQDKAPLYFVQAARGHISIAVYPDDSAIMVSIKQFMAAYGLVDIKMRMLTVEELLKIQGFPEDYKMVGNQSDKKKFIGNSVVPLITKAWAEAMARPFSHGHQQVA